MCEKVGGQTNEYDNDITCKRFLCPVSVLLVSCQCPANVLMVIWATHLDTRRLAPEQRSPSPPAAAKSDTKAKENTFKLTPE